LYSNTKLRAFYGKWVDALFTYDVEIWEEYLKASTGNGSAASSHASRPAKVCHAACMHACPSIFWWIGGLLPNF